MKLVALSGGIYSGKTTLANALSDEGYFIANFTRVLKMYAERALFACGNTATWEYIEANKSQYRAFLQELGTLIGFDTHPKFVMEAIAQSGARAGNPIVFDNVRTEAQAKTLRSLGFKIVQLNVSPQLQLERALDSGNTVERFKELLKHPVEQGITNPDLVLDASDSLNYNVGTILNVTLVV